jgi:hypothetical protein
MLAAAGMLWLQGTVRACYMHLLVSLPSLIGLTHGRGLFKKPFGSSVYHDVAKQTSPY